MTARRVFVTDDPFRETYPTVPWQRGRWPARWVHLAGSSAPFVAAFRCRFAIERAATVRLHVSADERYELFLDGERIGRGSERGDISHWFFESYELELEPGPHLLVARVWALGSDRPFAQLSIEPGLLLAAEGESAAAVSTGRAEWEARLIGGYEFSKPGQHFGTCSTITLDAAGYAWGFERGEGDGWKPARIGQPGTSGPCGNELDASQRLFAATLPAMLEVVRQVGRARFATQKPTALERDSQVLETAHEPELARSYDRLLSGQGPHRVPARSKQRVIIDLADYYCAYPELVTSGGAGARIATRWAESLYEQPKEGDKGQRDAVIGKYFIGWGETFLTDGGQKRALGTLWWQAGRFLELIVETGDEPLTLESLRLRETRYPLELESTFAFSDPRLERVIPIMVRALQMCSHETYMDCPYYEQLMYVGDTRLEVLATYATSSDDRLPQKAVRLFDVSRLPDGFTYSRFPSRVFQVIPTFSLWWVGMVFDYALYRGNREFVAERLKGTRAVLDAFLGQPGESALIRSPEYWNFVDWVPEWPQGIPPGAHAGGISGLVQWHVLLALGYAAKLERWAGEPELAERYERRARELFTAVHESLWCEKQGLFAEDLAQSSFSEHSQALAIVSGLLGDPEQEALVTRVIVAAAKSDGLPEFARTTIYFSHYLFDAFARTGRADALFERLALWFELDARGFKTTFEAPGNTRSDCHAWGAHPLHHYYASILGVRPATFGFERVRIAPNLGPLTRASGKLIHPAGSIDVSYERRDGKLHARVSLPPGIEGEFVLGGKTLPLVGPHAEFALG